MKRTKKFNGEKMSNKKRRRPVAVVNGEALDQEVIIRQRPLIEDYIRESGKVKFRKTKVFWSMNKKGNFDFTVEFYA
jgi:hypothetical protein